MKISLYKLLMNLANAMLNDAECCVGKKQKALRRAADLLSSAANEIQNMDERGLFE